MVKKLTTGEFCSAVHKKAYLAEQEKFALQRLLENQSRFTGKADATPKKSLDEAVAEKMRAQQAAEAPPKGKARSRKNSTDSLASGVDEPVEGDYLVEQVRARSASAKLAIPEAEAQMEVAPLLPEFESGVDAARIDLAAPAAPAPKPPKVAAEVAADVSVEGRARASHHAGASARPLFTPWVPEPEPDSEALGLLAEAVVDRRLTPTQNSGATAKGRKKTRTASRMGSTGDSEPIGDAALVVLAEAPATDTPSTVWQDAPILPPSQELFTVSSHSGLSALFRATEMEFAPEPVRIDLSAAPGALDGIASPDPFQGLDPNWAADGAAGLALPALAWAISPEWHRAGSSAAQIEAAVQAMDERGVVAEAMDLSLGSRATAPAPTTEMDSYGAKRFAFSRLPECHVSGPIFAGLARETESLDLSQWSASWDYSGSQDITRAGWQIPYLCETVESPNLPQASALSNTALSGTALSGTFKGGMRMGRIRRWVGFRAREARHKNPASSSSFQPQIVALRLPGLPAGFGIGHQPAGSQHELDSLSTQGRPTDLLPVPGFDIASRPPVERNAQTLAAGPITPPARVASVKRVLEAPIGPPRGHSLFPLELPFKAAALARPRLLAHGEIETAGGVIAIPRPKHSVRPAQEAVSLFAALGPLAGVHKDFSLPGIHKHWSRIPSDLRLIAMGVTIVIGLLWFSTSPQGRDLEKADVRDLAPEAKGAISRVFGDDSLLEVKRTIQRRAAVELSDDFRQGLGEWSGVGDWARGWSYDPGGFLRPRQMAFYTPSLELEDYRFEFLGQIERKALSWVFRAADPKNYYVNRLEIAQAGPLPEVVLVRYAVVGGKAGARTVTRLPMQVQMDTLYRVRVDVAGPNFVTTIQGQVVDTFTDDRIMRGGVGFYANPGEDVRLRWVEVSHQYDFLGRLCAFLVPYNVSNNTMRSGQ